MQDKIKQNITINADIQKVYEAISDPSKITTWFPDGIEGEMNEGDTPIMDFGVHGKHSIRIVAANPHSHFAFRWVPGAQEYIGDLRDDNSTLVEFKLEEKDGQTVVNLVESGFTNLPVELAESAFKDNSGGWEYMLGRLQKLFAGN